MLRRRRRRLAGSGKNTPIESALACRCSDMWGRGQARSITGVCKLKNWPPIMDVYAQNTQRMGDSSRTVLT